MEKHVLHVFVILFAAVAASRPYETKQYRTDYVYNNITDAFYKLHTEPRRGWQAQKICEVEGARLMGSSEEDKMQLYTLLLRVPHKVGQNVWVGCNKTHKTAKDLDLTSAADTPEEWLEKSCYVMNSIYLDTLIMLSSERLPFICKVEAINAPYDERCGSYGTAYHYEPNLGSCYKIPRIAYRWHEAYAECQAEGGHLLILNSEEERRHVAKFTFSEPWVTGSGNRNYLLAGFKEVLTGSESRVFLTIYNETLEEAGFSEWQQGEPIIRNEQCGSVYERDATLADVECGAYSGFVCEREITVDTNSQDVTETTPYELTTPSWPNTNPSDTSSQESTTLSPYEFNTPSWFNTVPSNSGDWMITPSTQESNTPSWPNTITSDTNSQESTTPSTYEFNTPSWFNVAPSNRGNWMITPSTQESKIPSWPNTNTSDTTIRVLTTPAPYEFNTPPWQNSIIPETSHPISTTPTPYESKMPSWLYMIPSYTGSLVPLTSMPQESIIPTARATNSSSSLKHIPSNTGSPAFKQTVPHKPNAPPRLKSYSYSKIEVTAEFE